MTGPDCKRCKIPTEEAGQKITDGVARVQYFMCPWCGVLSEKELPLPFEQQRLF